MASGYKPNNLHLDLPDQKCRGFSRGRRKSESREGPAPVKIICQDGQHLEEPRVAKIEGKADQAFRLRMHAPASEKAILQEMLAMGFKHSVPLHGYIADFFHARLKLVVEIDGPCHAGRREYDRKRDFILRKYGIRTMRYRADDAYERAAEVLADIRRLLPLLK